MSAPNSRRLPVTVDTAAPTAAVAITAIATDSGTSSSDFITNDTTLTVSGTHGSLGSGETVQVSSDGGASWFDATSTASTWSYTDPTPHGTSFTYQARIVDTVGQRRCQHRQPGSDHRHGGADGSGCDHGHYRRQRHLVERLYHQRHDADGFGHARRCSALGETVQVSSDGGASWADATSTASTWSYTDPTTHVTSFTYRVRIVDTAGNVDVNTASQAVTIDTAAPAAPSITAIPENGDGGGIDPDEASDGTPVVVGLAGTGAAAGDTLTINWGSQTVNYTLLAGDILGQQRDGDGAGRDDRGAGPGHVRRDGQTDRHSGQCQLQLDGDLGNGDIGRHIGADGGGCDHGHCHRQRRLVERLCHQRHDADGFGHARPARPRRDGAGQQRRRRQLVRCHQHGKHLELYRSHDARHQLHLPGADHRQPRAMSVPTPPARR